MPDHPHRQPVSSGRIILPEPEDPWSALTPEGQEYDNLRTGAAMSFAERIAWLEQMIEFARLCREARRGTPT